MRLHDLLLAAGTGLVLLQAAKFVSTLLAIRWLVGNGRRFSVLVEANRKSLTQEGYWSLLDGVRARNIPPFGIMEYRLQRFASRRAPILGRVIRWARAILFDFASLALFSMILLYVTSAPSLRRYFGESFTIVATTSAVLLMVQLMTVYAESCVSYATIGSYGLGFHGGYRYVSHHGRELPYFAEVNVLAGAVIYSLLAGTFVLYFSAWHGADFGSLIVSGTSPATSVIDILDCAYFSLVTFVAADSAGPMNGLARLAVSGIVMQGLAALILVISTMALYVQVARRT